MNACFGYASENLTERIRAKTFASLLQKDISYFDDPRHSTGFLTSSLSSDAQDIQGISGLTLGTVLTVLVNLVGCVVVALVFGWKLALVATALLPLLLFSAYFRLKVIKYFSDRAQSSYEKSANVACEAVAAIRTVQSLTRESDVLRLYLEILEGPLREGLKSAKLNTLLYAFSASVNFAVNAVVFYYGGHLVAFEGYTVAQLFTVFIGIVFGSLSAGRIFSTAPDFGRAKVAGRSILSILRSEPVIDSRSSAAGDKIDSISGNIEFSHVFFNYPSRPEVSVLEDLSFRVKSGQFCALVGESGSGKSTTASLLERFYLPTSGKILLDGKDISLLNVSEYRSKIGLVSQEPNLFDMTIQENISFGKSGATMIEIESAAKQANIHHFILSLPEGYQTRLGSKGSQLSGGQKYFPSTFLLNLTRQRIAIARALVREPAILLLDEATSALDADSEKVVQEALNLAARGRTTIAIAHRLSTIQHADVIYVLKDGCVVESGSPQELMSKKGEYWRLVQKQSM